MPTLGEDVRTVLKAIGANDEQLELADRYIATLSERHLHDRATFLQISKAGSNVRGTVGLLRALITIQIGTTLEALVPEEERGPIEDALRVSGALGHGGRTSRAGEGDGGMYI